MQLCVLRRTQSSTQSLLSSVLYDCRGSLFHSADSGISWRVDPCGIASAAVTVSALWELSREILTGLDQFIVCHLGYSCRSRLQLCARWVYCKHAMPCHQPGFTVQRVISRQVLGCVVLRHHNNDEQIMLNSIIISSMGHFECIKGGVGKFEKPARDTLFVIFHGMLLTSR